MSTVEEHFAILRAMGPQQGGWLTEPFHLAAARFLGAHLDELEAAWASAKALTTPPATPSAMASPTTSGSEPAGRLSVETAAIWIGATVFTLPRPNRHHNVMWWLHVLGVTSARMHEQGFVLSNGEYASREEAWRVAVAAGQLIGEPPCPGTLFSEDLWEGGAEMASMEAIKSLATASPAIGSSHRLDEPSQSSTEGLVERLVAQVVADEGRYAFAYTEAGATAVVRRVLRSPAVAAELATIEALTAERDEARQLALNQCWRAVDALGGSYDPADPRACGYDDALRQATAEIEKLGGKWS